MFLSSRPTAARLSNRALAKSSFHRLAGRLALLGVFLLLSQPAQACFFDWRLYWESQGFYGYDAYDANGPYNYDKVTLDPFFIQADPCTNTDIGGGCTVSDCGSGDVQILCSPPAIIFNPPQPPNIDIGTGGGGSIPPPPDEPTCNNDGAAEGANPFSPHDGNVQRKIADLAMSGGGLIWQRNHNSIARTEFSERTMGNGGGWRHNWQYELASAVSAEFGEVLEFYYPDGQRTFLQLQPDGTFAAPGDYPERARLLPNGDCVLTAPDGTELHFVVAGTYEGRSRFAPTVLTTSTGREYVMARDAQGRLSEVRDPEGRWLRLTYRDLALPGNPHQVVVNLKTVPASGQWLDIDIPAGLRAAAKGVFLRAAPGANVAEAQFFAEGSDTPLSGSMAGDYSAAALDGNPATSFKVGLTQRLIGYEFAAGQTVKLAKVRLLAAPGTEAALHESKVVLDLAVVPQEALAVIAKVESSDGRAVAYDYEISQQGMGGQAVLTAAHYGDGTDAIYRYSTPADQVGGGALLVEADDPRYAGPAKHIKYSYYQPRSDGVLAGTIKAEINPATGHAWARLEFDPADPGKRTVYYSDDRFHEYHLAADGSGRIERRKDSLGRVTRFEFGPGKWSGISAAIKSDGKRFDLTRNARGEIVSVRDQQGRERKVERDAKGRALRQTDAHGRVTTTARDAKGRITRVAKPDGQTEEMTRDANGRVIAFKGRGKDAEMTYDALGRQTSVTEKITGGTTRFTYDTLGRRDSTTDPLGRTTRYEYDERGKVTAIISATGLRHSYRYDKYGRKIAETNAAGHTAEYAYDELSRLTRSVDFAGKLTAYTYAEFPGGCGSCTVSARPTRVVGPDGVPQEFLYDTEGRVLARTLAVDSPAAETTVHAYDNRNQLVSVTDPAGAITRYTYDEDGHRLSATDPLGRVTKWTYDERGNTTSITGPDGGITRTTYDANDRVVATTDAAGNTTRYTYDADGNIASVTDAERQTTSYVYEGRRPSATIYADGKRATWEYDAAGRVIRSTTPDGVVTTTTYDVGNRVLTQTVLATPASVPAITTFTYDSLGRRTSATDAIGRIIRWTYDAHGNVLTTVRPDGLQTAGTYDARNLLTSTDAALQTTRFEYDSADNQTALTDANGHTYRFTYDALHRRTAMIYPDNSQEKWSYDTAGRQVSYLNRSGQTKTISYNNGGQPVSETWTDAAVGGALRPDLPAPVNYDYNSAGQLTGLTNGQARLSYAYDDLGRLASETSDLSTLLPGFAPHTVTYRYDKLGRRAGLIYPDGTKVKYDYDIRGRLLTIDDRGQGNGSGQVLARYDYNALGQIEKLSRDNDVITRYAFDMAGQLTDITHEKGSAVLASSHYALDQLGRRTAQTREDGITENYSYDVTGQLTGVDYGRTPPDRETFAYDPLGNRTQAWRSAGQQNATTSYTTNPLNQYTQTSINDVATALAYDGNGNVIGLVDMATGTKSATYDYNAFGETIQSDGVASVTNHFRFSTKYTDDETGLLYYGFRFYQPTTGRWLSRDLIEERGGKNLYAFLGNNPIGQVDSVGLCDCKVTSGPIVTYKDETNEPGTAHLHFFIGAKLAAPGTACEFKQLVKGHLTVNGVATPFNSTGSQSPVVDSSYVDDGYTIANNLVPLPDFVVSDDPGVNGMVASSDIDYYVTFKAQIIDKKTGTVVAEKDGYWVEIKGVYKKANFLGLFGGRKIKHGGFDN